MSEVTVDKEQVTMTVRLTPAEAKVWTDHIQQTGGDPDLWPVGYRHFVTALYAVARPGS